MRNDFKGNKKLCWQWVIRSKQETNNGVSGIKHKSGEMLWIENTVGNCWKVYFKK